MSRVAGLGFFSLLVAASLGANSARVYRNEPMRVRSFEPPVGWELAPQSSYPRLLASYAHREGGRLTLSAQKVQPGVSAQTLVDQSKPALSKQGFTAIRVKADVEGVRLDAELDGGKRFVKQLYLVDTGIGYVVTLVAPLASAQRMTNDFEEALKSLNLGSSAPPPQPADLGIAP
jgi:hypothetical protein